MFPVIEALLESPAGRVRLTGNTSERTLPGPTGAPTGRPSQDEPCLETALK
jgi:hypothetical protein